MPDEHLNAALDEGLVAVIVEYALVNPQRLSLAMATHDAFDGIRKRVIRKFILDLR